MQKIQKLTGARRVVEHIIQGKNPKTGEKLSREDFLDSPEILRGLSYVMGVLTEQIEKDKDFPKDTRKPFDITTEQLAQIVLPEYKIGVNEFAKCINKVIDIRTTKGITGAQINTRLKEEGILSEKLDEEGKKRTVVNKTSQKHGLESIPASFNGREYEKIVFNDKGKALFLDGFIHLMKLEEAAAISEDSSDRKYKK